MGHLVRKGESMKNIVLALSFLVLTSFNAFAIEREITSDTGTSGGHTKDTTPNKVAGQSNFERIGISGNTTLGNPGYLVMESCSNNGYCYPFYLWVDGSNGKLCTASYPTISTYASFPTGDWRTGMPCTVVGGQS